MKKSNKVEGANFSAATAITECEEAMILELRRSLPPLGRRRRYAYSLPQRRLGSIRSKICARWVRRS